MMLNAHRYYKMRANPKFEMLDADQFTELTGKKLTTTPYASSVLAQAHPEMRALAMTHPALAKKLGNQFRGQKSPRKLGKN
jgi:hypothetical protein